MQSVTKKKRGAMIAAAVVIAALGMYLGIFLWAMLSESVQEFAAVLVMVLYGGMILAVIAGVLAALAQRMKELDGGEEEDAKKY